jgi:outer membrane protein OmpA-like peptidoglycan-associated protein
MLARAAALLGLLVLCACATPPPPPPPPPPVAKPARDDLVVLLPDQDGKTGALSVTHGNTERVLDTPYAAARIKEEGRLETGTSTPAEVNRAFGEALAAQPPRPVSFLLYFLEGKDALTPESQQVVQQIFAEIARRPAPEIVIIGHTDRVGTMSDNDKLSLQRARKVRDDLIKLGIPADQIQVAGRGEREPLVPTEDEVPEPRNRRVEISVR